MRRAALRRFAAAAGVLLLAAGTLPAQARPAARASAMTGQVRATLLAQPGAAGPAYGLVLLLDVAPGWHLSWLNPGETGLPTVLEWELPPGWQAVRTRWPAPERLVADGVVAHVLRDTVPLHVTLRAPAAGGAATVRVRVRYGVCREVCIPQKLSLALTLPAVAADAEQGWRRAMAAVERRLPRPLPTAQLRALVTPRGPRLGFRPPEGWRADSAVFFPLAPTSRTAAAVVPLTRQGGWTWVPLPPTLAGKPLRGVLRPLVSGAALPALEVDVR